MTMELNLKCVETIIHGRTVFPDEMEAVRRNFLDLEGAEDPWTDPNLLFMYDHRLTVCWQIDKNIPPFEIDRKAVNVKETEDDLDEHMCLPSRRCVCNQRTGV